MPEPINTVSLADALVHSNHRFRKECMLIVMAAVEEVTKHMRVINNLKGKETESTIVPQAKFRPYHSEKIVSGTGGLTARTIETFPLEILEEFDPENLYTTIYGVPVDVEKINLDIVRRILTEEMNNASRGLCDLIFKGVRVADGIGALDGFDGFDTIIANEIAAGNIGLSAGNFTNLGEVNSTNIGDVWKRMYRKMDEKLRGGDAKKLVIVCTPTEYDMYKNWYAQQFGAGNFAGTPEQTYLDGTANKVQILPLVGTEGMKHCFITTEENMKVGFDVLSNSTKFNVRVPDNPHMVQMYAKIYMGVEFANIDKEFLMVGARTVKDDSVYMDTDKTSVTFADTTLGQSKTATVKLLGFNLTATSDITVEGTNKSEFTLSADAVTADDANADEGEEITITFAPTNTAGDRNAQLRISNATDNVNIVIPLSGKGVE
ncbi:MAG: hypothetical protein IJ057_13115 [Bacteroidales bacterium]|nr:hypothetical protein [Bacteroidales bacterium]